jgi:hypothetical protein
MSHLAHDILTIFLKKIKNWKEDSLEVLSYLDGEVTIISSRFFANYEEAFKRTPN